jgi:hypothetical protein
LTLPGGQISALNVAWSPVIAVTGAGTMIGPGADGLLVVDTRASAPGTPVPVRIEGRATGATRAGAGVTFGCLAALMLIVARLVRQRGGTTADGASASETRSRRRLPRRVQS